MSTMAQISRSPAQRGPNFMLLTSRRAPRLPILVAVVAAGSGLLADRLALTRMARDATAMAGVFAGSVRDARGEPLAGATVTFSDASGSSAVQTDTGGRFASRRLPPGSYRVRAELFGFEPGIPLSVEVPSHRPTELRMALAPAPLPDPIERSR